MAVKFDDFTIQVKNAMGDAINVVLEECAGEMESAVKRNTRVDTGRTKNSFRHHVDDANHVATIGSSEENAIWEEFGTGEYAINGNGRAFWNAYMALKSKIIKHIQNSLKGL